MNILNQYDIYQDENYIPRLATVNQMEMDYPFDNGTIENQMIVLNDCLRIGEYESEHQFVIARDYDGYIKGIYLLGVGNTYSVIISRRNMIIFLALIGASDFYILHNHPNDNLEESEDDIVSNAFNMGCGEMIEIPCMGGYVVTRDGWLKIGESQPKFFREV